MKKSVADTVVYISDAVSNVSDSVSNIPDAVGNQIVHVEIPKTINTQSIIM